MDPYEIEDTSDWLGSPTELETCKHYLAMVENDVQALTLQLRKARGDIFGLVQMHSTVADERDRSSPRRVRYAIAGSHSGWLILVFGFGSSRPIRYTHAPSLVEVCFRLPIAI